jgi:tryptophan-rich sensory protein
MNSISMGQRWRAIAVGLLSAMAVAALGASATDIGPWYQDLQKPSWNPPVWAFGPAWTIIFALTAISGIIAWLGATKKAIRQRILITFALNGLLNVLWSELFFKFHRPDWALLEVVALWLSIIAMMQVVSSVSLTSVRLLSAYLAWVTFAGILNLEIVRLNGPFASS